MARILIYATQMLGTGGIESHIKEFCAALAAKGHSIDLVCPRFELTPTDELELRRRCQQIILFRRGKSNFRIIWLFLALASLRLKKYDVIYSNGQGRTLALIKYVATGKTMWVHHHHTAGDAEDQASWPAAYWKVMSTADVVVACSKRNATDISLALDRDIQTVPCFSRDLGISANRLPSKAPLRFGYFGRLIPTKGIDLLAKLSTDPDLKDVSFHLWGEGLDYDNIFFDRFPNLHYHGRFNSQDELSNVLMSIDACVLLSTHREGLPISLLEAMSAGIPWVATDRGGIPDIEIDSHSTRIIPATLNYPDVVIALRALTNDILSEKTSSQLIVDFYQQHFSRVATTDKWLRLMRLHA